MLKNYKNIQPIAYKILKNTINSGNYSHAYLFETNGFYDSYSFILSFVKAILCPSNYTSNEKCKNCYQCKNIDNNNYPEIEIINPDGMWIKKEQTKDLQEIFSKKSIMGTKKIYIITEANKLNQHSANSMLKFLEDPSEDIIAILITDNIYQVLETIRSRCQIISLKNITDKKNLFLEKKEMIDNILKFIEIIEKYHKKSILYVQKYWINYIKTKEDSLFAFDIMILFYKDVLNKKIINKLEYFDNYLNKIEVISNKNNIKQICHKINVLTKNKEYIKYNANSNLLMDKILIEMENYYD